MLFRSLGPFNGPVERRGHALICDDPEMLATRLEGYFNDALDDEAVKALHPSLMMTGNRINGPKARRKILKEASFDKAYIKPFLLKPFDQRWCYLANIRPLFSEPSPDLLDQSAIVGNRFLVTRDTADKADEGPPISATSHVTDYDYLSGHARLIPFWVWSTPDGRLTMRRRPGTAALTYERRANLSPAARAWLAALGLPDPDTDPTIAALPWHHALAIGYSPAWLQENADGIRQDWPRVPLPNTADLLRSSAALGARVAALLDPETPDGGGSIQPADRMVTAGWGHAGKGGAVMPGRGRIVRRPFTEAEQPAAEMLGPMTNDIYLNADTYWANIPDEVWDFTIGGYQVLKKWLSYREHPLLGRPLATDELRHVRDTARRLAALRLMAPELDANYRACAAAHRPLT